VHDDLGGAGPGDLAVNFGKSSVAKR